MMNRKKTDRGRTARAARFLSLFAVCLGLLLGGFPGQITQAYAKESRESKDFVTDGASLFTKEEEAALQEECARLADLYQLDFAVVTTEDKGGKSVFDYIYDFYMERGYGYNEPGGNGFALLIDMEDRNVYILSRGSAPRWVADKTLSGISGEVSPFLSKGEYASGCGFFLTKITQTLDGLGYVPGTEPENDMTLTREKAEEGESGQRIPLGIRLLGALTIGAVSTGIAVFVFRGTDKNTSTSQVYLKGGARVRDSRDVFVNRTQTKRPRPKKSDSGGSSGGNSFGSHFDRNTGGGGSKF